MPIFDVYSRQGCHLCEVLIESLVELVRDRAVIRVNDIDTRTEWRADYQLRVPVVACDGTILCELLLDREAVLEKLAEHA